MNNFQPCESVFDAQSWIFLLLLRFKLSPLKAGQGLWLCASWCPVRLLIRQIITWGSHSHHIISVRVLCRYHLLTSRWRELLLHHLCFKLSFWLRAIKRLLNYWMCYLLLSFQTPNSFDNSRIMDMVFFVFTVFRELHVLLGILLLIHLHDLFLCKDLTVDNILLLIPTSPIKIVKYVVGVH